MISIIDARLFWTLFVCVGIMVLLAAIWMMLTGATVVGL